MSWLPVIVKPPGTTEASSTAAGTAASGKSILISKTMVAGRTTLTRFSRVPSPPRSAKLCRKSRRKSWTKEGAMKMMSLSATSRPTAVDKSLERATLPFSLAFLSFCAEACSVLSPVPLSSDMAASAHHAKQHVQHLPRQAHIVFGHEAHDLRQHEEPEQGDHGKAQREEVERGRDASKETKADLHHQGGEDHGHGQQHGRREHPGHV